MSECTNHRERRAEPLRAKPYRPVLHLWVVVSSLVFLLIVVFGLTLTRAARAFEVENQAPYAPGAPAPVDGAADVSLNPVLAWSGGDPDGDLVTYTVAFGDATPPPVVTTTAGTTYRPSSLITGTHYYWQVSASDGFSETVGSVWSFTTTTTAPTVVYLPLVLRNYPSAATPRLVVFEAFMRDT